MADSFAPGFALFGSGFVAVLFWLVAGLVVAVAPASPVLDGLCLALAGRGGSCILGEALLAAALRLLAAR